MSTIKDQLFNLFFHNSKVVPHALLYAVAENCLQYNVVCSSPLKQNIYVCGCGVSGFNNLKVLLGNADAPVQEYSVSPRPRMLGKAITADLALDRDGYIKAIRVISIADRPIVGISWRGQPMYSLYPEFAEILERNGGLAVFLPLVHDDDDANALLRSIDGLMMTGGGDFSPATFGSRQTPHGSQSWSITRDKSDLLLIKNALVQNIPLLGICRGMQGMNIATGGKIIQDIPLYLGQKLLDKQIDPARVTSVISGTMPGSDLSVPDKGYKRRYKSIPYNRPTFDEESGTYLANCGCKEGHLRIVVDGICHDNKYGPGYHVLQNGHDNTAFVISKDSKWLYPILQRETMEFITSTHHQAVDPENLGNGISIAAMSSDGIIEAIEYKDNLFALGVQWHPERDALHYFHGFPVDQQLCNAPMRALVDYSRIYRTGKHM